MSDGGPSTPRADGAAGAVCPTCGGDRESRRTADAAGNPVTTDPRAFAPCPDAFHSPAKPAARERPVCRLCGKPVTLWQSQLPDGAHGQARHKDCAESPAPALKVGDTARECPNTREAVGEPCPACDARGESPKPNVAWVEWCADHEDVERVHGAFCPMCAYFRAFKDGADSTLKTINGAATWRVEHGLDKPKVESIDARGEDREAVEAARGVPVEVEEAIGDFELAVRHHQVASGQFAREAITRVKNAEAFLRAAVLRAMGAK